MEIRFDDSALMSKLAALSDIDQNKALEAGMLRGAILVQDQAKLLAPVDSGELRLSIHSKVEREDESVASYVYTDSDHAAFVEFGTGQAGMTGGGDGSGIPVSYREDWAGMSPQPYLYPAAKGRAPKVAETIRRGILIAIRKLAKGG